MLQTEGESKMEAQKTDKVIGLKTAVCMAFFAVLCGVIAARADVFSDAAVWHQGFYGSNGTLGSSSTTAFPDKLRAGNPSSGNHTITREGYTSGVQLTTATVDYPNPYSPNTVLVSRSETVAYMPQDASGYSYSDIMLTNPFAVTNTGSFTFFVRFKWDGTARWNKMARFLNAGYHYQNSGFLLGVHTNGKLELYAKDGVTETGGTSVYSDTWMVSSNVWTDCAVVVEDSTMKVYVLAAGGAMKSTVMTTTFGKSGTPTSYKTWIRLGGEQAKQEEKQSVFPGWFHAFASWPRALSEDEVKQVFAYPSTADLVRLGTKNGNSLEFKGATLGGAGSGSATEDWAKIAPSLTAGAPSLSIPFTVPANFAGVAQVLRVAFATNSALQKVNVSVGGTAVGELTAKPGESDLLTIKSDLLTSGAKTLTLTRAGSSGDVVFDAIVLGGGFQLGTKDSKKDEIGAVSGKDDVAVVYYSCCTNSILTNVRDDLPHHNTREYTKQYFHVYVPDEIAGSDECKIVFKSSVKPKNAGHIFALSVNGSEVARKTITANAWTAFECDVPATALVPGNNVFIFANVAGGSYEWCNIDYYRFETIYKKKRGFCVIVF